MRRFKLWGQENAMVEDPEGEFVLWADIAPVLVREIAETNWLHSLQAYHTLKSLAWTHPHRTDLDLDHPNLITFRSH